MVHGGRSWVRVASLVGSVGVVGLMSMAGCGGRTSTLDPDAYGPPSAGNGGGPPIATAGKSSGGGSGSVIGVSGTGAGGAPTKPVPTTGGKGGAGALDPSLAIKPCSGYCPGYSIDCASKLKPGQDCMASCEAEINSSGARCQQLGISALQCLSPFLTPGVACDTALSQGLAKCGMLVASFQQCKGQPTPTPVPPSPTPIVDVGSCPSMGDTSASPECKALFSCQSGVFETYCQQNKLTGGSYCTCVNPQGQTTTAELVKQPDACRAAARLCLQ